MLIIVWNYTKKFFLNKYCCNSKKIGVYQLPLGCSPMYPECVAFLHKTMRVREIVVLVRLSHSHGFAQKRNAFRIHGRLSVPLTTYFPK